MSCCPTTKSPDPVDYGPIANATNLQTLAATDMYYDAREWMIQDREWSEPYINAFVDESLEDGAFQRDYATTALNIARAQTDNYHNILRHGIDSSTETQRAAVLSNSQIQNRGLDIQNRGMDLSNRVAEPQIAAMNQQIEHAQDYYDYNKSTFRPVERDIVRRAHEFNTGEHRDRQAAATRADYARFRQQQTDATNRSLAARGVRPDSPAARALAEQGNVVGAAHLTNASNQSRQAAEAMGHARMTEAAGLGRNLPSFSTNAYMASSQAGNTATGAINAGTNAFSAAANAAYQQGGLVNQASGNIIQGATAGLGAANTLAGLGLQGFQGASQSGLSGLGARQDWSNSFLGNLNAAGGNYMNGLSGAMQGHLGMLDSQTSIYNNQVNANAEMTGAIFGGLTGMVPTSSDIRLKENIELIGQYPNGMNQYEFSYREDLTKQRYRGVMAQEVEMTRPEAVVTDEDGYKAVIYDLLGIEMEKV